MSGMDGQVSAGIGMGIDPIGLPVGLRGCMARKGIDDSLLVGDWITALTDMLGE